LEIAGANIHDTKLLEATIEAIVVERPEPEQVEQNLCLDKGYDNPPPGTLPQPRPAICRTYAASAKRNSTKPAPRPIPPAAGSSNAPSPGSPNAGRS
jgi:hypothetical protein